MAAGRLPEREQRILDEMEAVLRHDHGLNRRLRTVRVTWRMRSAWTESIMGRGLLITMLTMTSLILLGVGIQTASPGVIWAFAAIWPLSLLGFMGLYKRRAKRRQGRT